MAMRHVVALIGVLVLTGCSASGWHDAEWWASVQAAAQAASEKQSAEAEARWQQAVAQAERDGPESWQVAYTLRRLALFYESQKRYDEAERAYKQTLAIWERTAPRAPAAARAVTDLAHLYHGLGRFSEAEALYRRALPMTVAAFGPTHRNVDVVRILLASLYAQQGRYDEAETLYKEVLVNEPSDPQALRDLVHIYETQGRYAEAEPLLRRLVTYWEATGNPRELADEIGRLAALLRKTDRPTGAGEMEARAQDVFPSDKVEVLSVTPPEIRRLTGGFVAFVMTATVQYRLRTADVARLQVSPVRYTSAECALGGPFVLYAGPLLPITRGEGRAFIPVRWIVGPDDLSRHPGHKYVTVQSAVWTDMPGPKPRQTTTAGAWAHDCFELPVDGSAEPAD